MDRSGDAEARVARRIAEPRGASMDQETTRWKDGQGLLFRGTFRHLCLRFSILTTAQLQDLPLEYNTWLLFRQVVDVILLK